MAATWTWRAGLVWACVIGSVLLGAGALQAWATAAPTPQPAQPAGEHPQPPPVPSADTRLGRGRLLFGAGCASCHGQDGRGSQRGPSLVGAGAAGTDFYLSTGRMPLASVVDQPEAGPPAYARSDIEALVAYVASLGPGPDIPVLFPAAVTEGRELYLANCASCHSSTGAGAALPEGHWAPSVLDTPPTQVAEAVRIGPGLMPKFSAGTLDDADVAAIAGYLQTLRANDERGGARLGGIGPITEGMVAWALGLGIPLVLIGILGKRAPARREDR